MEEEDFVDFPLDQLEDLCGNYIFPSQEKVNEYGIQRGKKSMRSDQSFYAIKGDSGHKL